MASAVKFTDDETYIGEAWIVVEHVTAVHDGDNETSHVYVGQHILRLNLPPGEVMTRLGFNNGGG